MLAYNKTSLHNTYVREQAEEAMEHGLLSEQQYKAIAEAHPVDLYTPNVFVKVGLGFLTIVIILLSVGLFVLLFQVYNSFSGFMVFYGLVCYALLEVIARKKHFNSGVDNVLAISTVSFIIG